ncbi:hypothetical protein IC229_34990 [Spirosoma sp. BT702]|uniref:DUF4595 domain-containing protein n=1 Tax=Spirosoma profusum TaxID=2771354 RepID=A0A927AWS9_9BACT|nr:hypothetical protein [Spirosoma profusum]MBD2705857.1 hypothetical protein [Spirosoma profusum]
MKRFLFSFTLFTTISLSSCHKNPNIAPTLPNTDSSAQTQLTAINGHDRTPLTPRLVKYGSRTLSYDTQGRLIKAVDAYQERTYEYTSNELSCVIKQDGKVQAILKYTLNAKGRCEKIWLNRTIYDGYDGKILSNDWHNYLPIYDLKGRLSQIQRENSLNLPSLRYEFSYNTDNNLVEIRFLENNKLSKRQLYSYDKPYTGALQVDKDPLNPSLPQTSGPVPFETYLLDLYVDVFGQFRQHLVRSYQEEIAGKQLANYYFTYKLGDNGYVMAQDAYNGNTNVYKSTLLFEYKTPFLVNPNL